MDHGVEKETGLRELGLAVHEGLDLADVLPLEDHVVHPGQETETVCHSWGPDSCSNLLSLSFISPKLWILACRVDGNAREMNLRNLLMGDLGGR